MITQSPVKRLVTDAVLLTAALIFSYIENLIPAFIPIPGLKLGLANIIIMFAFYHIGKYDSGVISGLRVTLISMLFGNVSSFAFSFAGAILSLITLMLTEKLYIKKAVSFIGISVLCAAAHNTGQMLAAMIMFQSIAVISYLPWLLLLSVPTGIMNGFIMNLVGRYAKFLKK